ncbi:lysine N(6)-hydroxylase/L-ornithine N(5)-oxygenase family protein [Actinomadura rupiterrae]|uniref:lysine N(6)-hydroxylase/L-ornithine N(5)-oxygenase family protein n=1 Tax=Actinomadura rupiterrae TaxID=559627 RepID=UPI0020A5F5FE|nr:SidA/IucD/PvdA family monooxygenase [Actinomadura rupiterrae]MCP2341717.1 L-ornithine N5-oxygenase [Actinomadura rupiterrae]
MERQEVELLAIGAGPANLALAVALEELAAPGLADSALIIERHDDIVWQRGMLLPWTQSQVSFLKDLVTLRNPRSEFSFVNYLHSIGRLDEFVNLGSFTPYRLEISDYLRWVGESLRRVRIEFGRRCVSVEPVPEQDGGVHRWLVRTADGGEILCRDLVIGAGRDPHVPDEVAALPRDRVVHSTEFSARMAGLDPDGEHRIVVVGGAQSAAEMYWASYRNLPNAQVTMVMRSIGLNAYESSKFTNELFYSSFVDEFHGALPEAREQLLREMHRTNYAGLAPAMLDTLYREMYQERLTGGDRLHMITMTEIAGARMEGGEVVLTLLDRKQRRTRELRCDMVLLGTGFDRAMPRLARDVAAAAGVGGATVDRNYRMNLPPDYTAGCYLQGVNEATHGIADSLLSVLAVRSQEIVADLLAHRGAAESVQAAADAAALLVNAK